MRNPLFDRSHLKEYLLFGTIAALVFTAFIILLLIYNQYENIVLLFLANIGFAFVIAIHGYMQVNRKHEGQSSVRMMISSHLTILAGIILACLFSVLATYIFFGDLTDVKPSNTVLENAHTTNDARRPAGLLAMILLYATVTNFAVCSFLSVLIAYVGKRNQVKDKPAEIDKNIHMVEK